VVISRYNANVIQKNAALTSDVITNQIGPQIPKEVILDKKGPLTRIKVAFSFLDKKFANTIANLDNIAVKYYDSSKRKFV
jgi:hypothetical protein